MTRPKGKALRRFDEELSERHFVARPSRRQWLARAALGLGGVALGAVTYAWTLRDPALGPLVPAPYLAVGGAALLAAYAFLAGAREARLRVGDLGVGVELGDGKVARTAWYELARVALAQGELLLEKKESGEPVRVSLEGHRAAARAILGEALVRVPKRVALSDDEVRSVGQAGPSDGAVVPVESLQVAGRRCRATDKPLTFEKDVRLCARCGVPYHRSAIPAKCLECGRRLKKGPPGS
jgi:hypothetical protein